MSRLWVTPEELDDQASSPYAYEACRTASFILWGLSGRRFTGINTVTEVYNCPRRDSLLNPRELVGGYMVNSLDPWISYLPDLALQAGSPCGCTGSIGGRHLRLRLRGRPVRSIQKVSRDGVAVDPGQYQLVNSSVLQSAKTANLDLCGCEITYTYGVEPPTAGRRAARYLARELAKSYGGDDCELPDRVTSVSRQGITMTVLDNQTFIDDMRTGIYSVDLFLKAVNPDKARKPARVFSPDVPRGERVRTTTSSPDVGPLDLAIVPSEPFTWTVLLTDISGQILENADWSATGQISSWNGTLLVDATPAHFTVTNGSLTLNLTAAETGRINIGGSGAWDLYALNADGSTVIHVMSSNVYLVGPGSA